MEEKYFKSAHEWRSWLAENFEKSSGIWLIYYKKATAKPSMNYEESIEEALCYGWIDSIIRKIDNEKFAHKFTPRKNTSKWSESNKSRVKNLIEQKRMASPGLTKVSIAKENGMWDKPDRPNIPNEPPKEFEIALDQNKIAKGNFINLAKRI